MSTKGGSSTKANVKKPEGSPLVARQVKPRPHSPDVPLLALQRSAGNRASTALLRATLAGSDREASFPPQVEADEREADALADRIDAVAANPPAPPSDPADTGSDSGSANPPAPPDSPSGLPRPLRDWLERLTGRDLSEVRIRADARAGAAAERLGAQAFAEGTDIFFAAGTYAPSSREGARLVAHEVAHTVQQGQSGRTGLQLKPDKEAATEGDAVFILDNVRGMEELASEVVRQGILKREDYTGVTLLADGYYFTQTTGAGAFYRVLTALEIKNAAGDITGYKVISHLHRPRPAAPAGERRPTRPLTKPAAKAPTARKPNPAKTGKAKRSPETAEPSKPTKESLKGQQPASEPREAASEDKNAKELRAAFDALPESVKEMVRPGGQLKPEDLPQLLRVAEKLKRLAPEDVAMYKLLSAKLSKDLDAFERSIDFFIRFKDEIRANAKVEKQASAKEPTLEEKLAETWKGFDEAKLGKLTTDQKEALARELAAKQRDIQLAHMAKHPGETALGMVEGIVRLDKVSEAIAEDVLEAADGNKGAYSRIAGAVGAFNKYVAAVAAIVFIALLFVPGVNLLELAAAGLAVTAANLAMSVVEGELRIKAAGEAKTSGEFKTQTAKAAAAQAQAVVAAAMIALVLAAKLIARIPLPGRYQNVAAALKAAQTALSERTGVGAAWRSIKAQVLTKLRSAKEGLRDALAGESKSLIQTAEAVKGMSGDEFVQHLLQGDPKLAELGITPDQATGIQQLAGTPEGTLVPEQLRQDALKALNDAPVEAGKKVDAFLKDVDNSIDKIDQAQSAEQVKTAADDASKSLSAEDQARQAAVDEQAYVKKRLEGAQRSGVRARAQEKLDALQARKAATQAEITRLEQEFSEATVRVNRLKNKVAASPRGSAERAAALEEFKAAKKALDQLTEADELGGFREERSKLRQTEEAILESLQLKRPTLWQSTKDAIRRAAKQEDGKFLDPNTGKPIEGEPVFGHVRGREHRRLVLKATEKGLTQEQFNAWVNDHPEWFQLESKASNESHLFEQPGTAGWESID